MRDIRTVTIKDGENLLTFRITPMNALKAEAWMYRAAIAIGANVDGSMLDTSKFSDADAILSLFRRVEYDKVQPLLAELLNGVERVCDNGRTVPVNAETIGGQVEYPTTITILRMAVLKANFDFFANGGWAAFLGNMSGALKSGD